MPISRVRTNVVLPAAGSGIVNMKLKLPRFNQLKIQLFGLLSFLLWASSNRNQTPWKFHLQKLKMGQRFGQSYLKMGQTFENTTFRFVNPFSVGFLRPKSNFQHLNRVIWGL